jgi:Na+-driven multidrug efflux pump
LKIKWEKLKSIVKVGLPLALQSAIYPFANMLIQTRINNTGTDNIAAYALCGKLDFIVWPVTESIGMAVTTFVAQNYGAKLLNRVKQGMKTGVALAVGTITVLDVILFVFCEQLGKLFLASCDHNVVPIMAHLLRFLLPFNLFYVVAEILCAVIRGRGETFRPMIITLVCTCGIRVLWIMVAVNQESTIKMILTSYPLSWIINGVAFIVFYRNFAIRS